MAAVNHDLDRVDAALAQITGAAPAAPGAISPARLQAIKQCGAPSEAYGPNQLAQVACQRNFNAASIRAAIRENRLEEPAQRGCWEAIAAHDEQVAAMAAAGRSNFPPEPACSARLTTRFDPYSIARQCPTAEWTLRNRGAVTCH